MKNQITILRKKVGGIPLAAAVLSLCIGCAAPSRFVPPPSHEKRGETPQPFPTPLTAFRQSGMASFYSRELHNYLTANGELYDMNALTAAHPTLPFNALVRVTNLATNLSVVVRINDRGPYTKRRIIDLSWAAANQIGLTSLGTGKVEIKVVKAPEK